MKPQYVEIFRCGEQFKKTLKESAQLMGLNKSSYIRWAVRTANRRIKSHGTGIRQS